MDRLNSKYMEATKSIKIMIVEDHEMFSESLATWLSENPNLQVIHRAANGREALNFMENSKEKVNLVLMDLQMEESSSPEPDGLRTAREIIKKYYMKRVNEIKIIMISYELTGMYVAQAYKLGIDGYLPKKHKNEELMTAIEAVMDGRLYYRGEVRKSMDQYVAKNKAVLEEVYLTNKEQEVLELISEGYGGKQIADIQNCAPGTVDTHRRNIMRKLDANNAPHMVAIAFRRGFLKIN